MTFRLKFMNEDGSVVLEKTFDSKEELDAFYEQVMEGEEDEMQALPEGTSDDTSAAGHAGL